MGSHKLFQECAWGAAIAAATMVYLMALSFCPYPSFNYPLIRFLLGTISFPTALSALMFATVYLALNAIRWAFKDAWEYYERNIR